MASNTCSVDEQEEQEQRQIMSNIQLLNYLRAATNNQQLQMYATPPQNQATLPQSQATLPSQATQEEANYYGIQEERGDEEEGESASLAPATNESELHTMLIEEIRKYPCIWDISSKSNKERPKKIEAWKRICASLQQPGKVIFVGYFSRFKDTPNPQTPC